MYLKKMEVQGFKSFADKKVLEFAPGLTAVVGPNGSGKSNIADAIRWVLGEQSAKSLRGSKMEDVIFAGTEQRKPLGFAEVSLTIDNGDMALPIDYTEVTVTRRVYRSGEGEYFINRTPCRLKDIVELFMDTGIGRDGYSIIGQGRIDEILSVKSEDRRYIFEEASGIMKYKTRKIEAEKKLDLTEQNLLRVNDIINELELQIEPLREQAEKAEKYIKLKEQLKEYEVNLYIDNIDKLKKSIVEAEQQTEIIENKINEEKRKLDESTKNNKEKIDKIRSIEEELENARNTFHLTESSIEKKNSDINLLTEKINNLKQTILRCEEEIKEIEAEKFQCNEEIEKKKIRIDDLKVKLSEYDDLLKKSETEYAKIVASLDEYEKSLEDEKTELIKKHEVISDKKTQLNNTIMQNESIKKRKEQIDAEVLELKLEKDRENIKKEDLSISLKESENLLKSLKSNYQKNISKRDEINLVLSNESKNLTSIMSDIQVKKTKLDSLKNMENSYLGYNRSVKSVLLEKDRSSSFGKGIHGALAQLIKVNSDYETAIEIALGGALQNIVTETEEDAKRAIEYLKINKCGRATFLPVASVYGKYIDNNILHELKNQKGFIAVASDIVMCDERFKGIVLSLLGKVAVVTDLDCGINIARKYKFSFKIVTVDGDQINAGGSMSGGSIENKGSGILGRKREIEDLERELELLNEKENNTRNKISELSNGLKELDDIIRVAETEIKEKELIILRDNANLLQVVENIDKISAKIGMLEAEKQSFTKKEQQIKEEIEAYEAEISRIQLEIEERKKAIEEYQNKQKGERSVREQLSEDITRYKISAGTVNETIASLEDNIQRLEHENDLREKNINKRIKERDNAKREIESNGEMIKTIKKELQESETDRVKYEAIIEELSRSKKAIEEDSYDIVNEINEINKNIALLQNDLSKFSVKKAKFESELDSIKNRLWEDYELTYSSAMELKKELGSISNISKNISQLRNELKNLGAINLNAIEEFEKTKERLEFMSRQRDDAVAAKDKLLKVIKEMKEIMEEKFIEQFNLINENFNIVFNELFDGGRAELFLTDEKNVLESGIEIKVQPPGKKFQNMMLLSGGERAFTAIALLFAILRLKPSPFCLLDEIEAALDEANVYRFADYLKKFTNETQFIIITHRKGTMEAADMLYGVTMQEYGVSSVVSMKMGEKAS